MALGRFCACAKSCAKYALVQLCVPRCEISALILFFVLFQQSRIGNFQSLRCMKFHGIFESLQNRFRISIISISIRFCRLFELPWRPRSMGRCKRLSSCTLRLLLFHTDSETVCDRSQMSLANLQHPLGFLAGLADWFTNAEIRSRFALCSHLV